ncbi:MAG TPA: spore coat protein [Mobilitalea sp.]|nr:spore coat protein [Mobilitalea sp.]
MITNVQLTTKERFLLEDARSHEEQCILKYDNYANLATDAELKAVFRSNGKKEEEHLQTINQLLSGKVPPMGGQNSGQSGGQSSIQSGQQSQQSSVEKSSTGSNTFKASDKDLCIDMLNTEKYVAGSYNTAIFEFKDAQVRDVLNHIQTEEQKHGEAIFAYMQSKGMYKPQ